MDRKSPITKDSKSIPYDSISTSARRALVKLVFEQKMSVRSASKVLGIKYTTGKALIQKFRKRGSIDRIRGVRRGQQDEERQEERDTLIQNMQIDTKNPTQVNGSSNSSSSNVGRPSCVSKYLSMEEEKIDPRNLVDNELLLASKSEDYSSSSF